MDWEAILSQDPEDFVKQVGSWLLPPEARPTPSASSSAAASGAALSVPTKRGLPDVGTLPLLAEVMATPRARVGALNTVEPIKLS